MSLKINFYFFLIIFSTPIFSSVQNICELPSASVSKVNNLQDLDRNLCQLPSVLEERPLETLTHETREIIHNLASDPRFTNDISLDPLDDESLVKNLRSISDLLTGQKAPSTFTPNRDDEISRSMSALLTEFGTPGARMKNPNGYYQAMRNVLSKTNQGARVLDCFERSEPRVTGTSVEFFDAATNESSNSASFESRFNKKQNNYTKVITLNLTDNPDLSLFLLGHEFQHACDNQQTMTLLDGIRNLESTRDHLPSNASRKIFNANADEIEKATAHLTVRNAIDEMRAYRMMPQLFSELAPYHPAFFCHHYGAGNLFGRQIMSIGEYMSSLETQIADGRFIDPLIEAYSIHGGYDPIAIYDTDGESGDYKKTAQGRKVIRPEVRSEFMAAGFRVP